MIIKESFSYDNLLKHVKHVIQYVNDPRCKKEAQAALKAIEIFGDKYSQLADELTYQLAGTSDSNSKIVGFITKDNRACKYNKDSYDFVVYDPTTKKTITMHKKSLSQFERIKDRDYKSELPENQEE